jgi:formamidopyrimidine-DNA glycosylase
MPELPDLRYIQNHLSSDLVGRTITRVEVRQPLVIRTLLDSFPGGVLAGRTFLSIGVHGPFLRFGLTEKVVMVTNLMLAGRLQVQKPGEKAIGHRCVSLSLDDLSCLHVCDEKVMTKLYLLHEEQTREIPRYEEQGVDILSPVFTVGFFRAVAARHTRKQVRVMLTDQTILSSIGNAYADEILFDAGIHPKTFVARLAAEELDRLHASIIQVMIGAIAAVEQAARPMYVKVREHLKVRNRHGEPCPRCGTTIRREGVRGYDVFFCPLCQPATRNLFVDWKSLKKDGKRG